ncbi:MAG: hypothetical protein KDC82_02935 [Bacteroidetes bacterium]|nr:hypothetical protein [Bacteroidota bacterium]
MIKFLILFLLSFNLYAVDCSMESEAHVDACTIDIKFHQMMKAVVPDYKLVGYDYYNSECPEGKQCDDPKLNSYTLEPFDNKNPKSYYDRLIMEKDKPSLSELNDALNLWKNTIKAKVRFKARVMAVDNDEFKVAAGKCGYKEKNKAILKKQIIEQEDVTKINCIEIKAVEFKNEKAQANAKKQLIEQAKDDIKNLDCSSIQDDFLKKTCIILQGL